MKLPVNLLKPLQKKLPIKNLPLRGLMRGKLPVRGIVKSLPALAAALPLSKLKARMPVKLTTRQRRLALGAAGLSALGAVGLLLQGGQSTEAFAAVDPKAEPVVQPVTDAAVLGLVAVPQDSFVEAALPDAPVALVVSRDFPVGVLPSEEQTPMLGCSMEMTAEPGVGALVDLALSVPCLKNARVTIAHAGLRFSDVLDADGRLEIAVPALESAAEFTAELQNGMQVQATADVPSLALYDRVALQWTGNSGLQIHAREFGAEYDSAGHVWFGNPRAVTAVLSGDQGFLMRLGDGQSELSRMADIYTFPRDATQRAGAVMLTVEAEVIGANCGRAIKAETLEVLGGAAATRHSLEMEMPGCGATGDFLVLKNLLQDLTIAQNE